MSPLMHSPQPSPPFPSTQPRLLCCHDCGAIQRAPSALNASLDTLSCRLCHSEIERSRGCSMATAFACASSSLLLLIPANLLPFISTSLAGVSRQSVVASSASEMLHEGYPELAIAVALFVIALPFVRMGLLSLVLGALRFDWRPHWLGRAFRWANSLQTWAMADVFLLAFAIAYARLSATISVELGAGAWCYVAAALLTLLTRATLDKRAAWQAISSDRTPAGATVSDGFCDGFSDGACAGASLIHCLGCDLLMPASMQGRPCPRCAATLRARKLDAVNRAAALGVAATILYVPANLYVMATLPIGLQSVQYTVLEGVVDLAEAKLYSLAGVVFLASFAIPLLKLAVMAWCIASVIRRSSKRLILKTRFYGVIEEIGRWSMVDPFLIACFVPVTQYNALIHGSAGPAAPVFAAVVILTTLAALVFDPRRLWDAAANQPASMQAKPRCLQQ